MLRKLDLVMMNPELAIVGPGKGSRAVAPTLYKEN